MNRFVSAFLGSLCCTSGVVASCVAITGPLGGRGWIFIATLFAGFFTGGLVSFGSRHSASVMGHGASGAIAALLAYPFGILLLGLVAQFAHSIGIAEFSNERSQMPPLISVWLLALSIWVLPGLIVSLVITVPISALAGLLFGLARHRDEQESWRTSRTRWRFKNQWLASAVLLALSSGAVAWRFVQKPETFEKVVIEKPAAIDVMIHEDS